MYNKCMVLLTVHTHSLIAHGKCRKKLLSVRAYGQYCLNSGYLLWACSMFQQFA